MAEEPEVDTEALQAAQFLKLSTRLANLEKLTESTMAEGVVEPIEPIAITDVVRRVDPPVVDKPWFCVEVTNDGPNDVWVLVNIGKSFEWHRVRVEEVYKVDMGRAIIDGVLLKCNPGETASVRLVGSR